MNDDIVPVVCRSSLYSAIYTISVGDALVGMTTMNDHIVPVVCRSSLYSAVYTISVGGVML